LVAVSLGFFSLRFQLVSKSKQHPQKRIVAKMNATLNTANEECIICLDDFKNGEAVFLLDCGGAGSPYKKHIVCSSCSGTWDALSAMDTDVEEISRKCPSCRRPIHTMTYFKAENFYPGAGTKEDPIRID
jgi:subtilase family serine protease